MILFRFSALIFVLLFISCTAAGKRLDSGADLVSDSGGITRWEMEKAAVRFADAIAQHFQENQADRVYLAHLPTRNETSEIIPVDFFDDMFVRELLKNKILTVRVKTRKAAMKEIQFSQTGLADRTLEPGFMAVPDYFVESTILENSYRSGGQMIVEQTISVELVDVETQLAVWTDRIVYRKQAVDRGGVKW